MIYSCIAGRRTRVTLTHLIAASITVASFAAAVPTDAAWLRANGTLIFHDTFEREETGNGAKAIGNGWIDDLMPWRVN